MQKNNSKYSCDKIIWIGGTVLHKNAEVGKSIEGRNTSQHEEDNIGVKIYVSLILEDSKSWLDYTS